MGAMPHEDKIFSLRTHEVDELIVNNLNNLLASCDAIDDFLAQGLSLNLIDKLFDHPKVDVGLKKSKANIFECALDIVFIDFTLPTNFFETGQEFVREIFKHGRSMPKMEAVENTKFGVLMNFLGNN